ETVEILEWVALLWILALAKTRSAAPDIRSDLGPASNTESFRGQKSTQPLPARDPLQYFNSLLGTHPTLGKESIARSGEPNFQKLSTAYPLFWSCTRTSDASAAKATSGVRLLGTILSAAKYCP